MLQIQNKKSTFFELKGIDLSPLSNKLSIVIIVIVTLLLYANTFTHEFVFDDKSVITKNSYVKEGIGGIKNILTQGSWDGYNPVANLKIYRPFQLLVFAIQYEFFGLNPTPYHIVNVLCYALLNMLLFLLLKEFWKHKYPYLPLIIVLLFATHPVHSEVVANLKGSADLFGMLHATAAFLFLFYFIKKNKKRYLVLASLFYFLSLISKEIAVTYIAVFPLAMYFFTDLKIKNVIRNTLPFIGIIGIYLLIRFFVFKGNNPTTLTITHLDNVILLADTYSQQIGMRLFSLGKNLQLLFFPHPLRVMYVYNDIPIIEANDFMAVSTICAYLVLSFVGVYFFRKKSILVFGILYYLLTISLFSNTYVMMPNIVAERWLLIPSLGFCIAVGFIFYKTINSAPTVLQFLKTNNTVLMMLFILLFLYSFKTIERNYDWKNSATLFAADIKTCPNNQIVLRSYGGDLMESEDLDKVKESIFYLEKARALAPTYYATSHNLGKAYYLLGDLDNAIAVYETIFKAVPQKYDSAFALGLVYNTAKRHKEALSVLLTLKGKADYKDTAKFKKQLYIAYVGLGQLEEAAKYAANNNLIRVNTRQDDSGKTIIALERELQLDPKNKNVISLLWESYNKTGLALMKSNEFEKIKESIFYFKKAQKLSPTNYLAEHNLGKAYYLLSDLENAIAVYEAIFQAVPKKYDSVFALGLVYNSAKRHKEALDTLLSLKDIVGYMDTPKYRKQLHIAYLGLGQLEEATKYAAK
jgi:tetratricopeptide (TPR) repeat protein